MLCSERSLDGKIQLATPDNALPPQSRGAIGRHDKTTIGSQQIRLEQWYASVLQGLISSFKLAVNLPTWWRACGLLSPVKCMGEFLAMVLLAEIEQPIVIFMDEIDSVLSLDFPINDFFAVAFSPTANG